MLFNSSVFLFLFLPLVLLGFSVLRKSGAGAAAVAWLVVSSLFFYGWWNPRYLILLVISVVANYLLGRASLRSPRRNRARLYMLVGIALNLGFLGYFKYANFFVDTTAGLTGLDLKIGTIALPLAISFFTFQQIAYQVDTFRGQARETRFLNYCLFVTFFPQLIAGPIVHHKEMMPQFEDARRFRLNSSDLAVGLTILIIGLFKKIVLADGIAEHSTPIYEAAAQGTIIRFFEAWTAALGYTLQVYFDFSGYSDMAIGLARMFGIILPLNFHSPYKAVNIIEFWRRWHMTLSRFLRNYVYITLGGNRRGGVRRYLNLLITMLLGGLWHGAAWTFVLWGALHGLYLIINHGWIALKRAAGISALVPGRAGRLASGTLTFLAVVVAFVLFRSESIPVTLEIFRGMLGLNGVRFAPDYAEWVEHIKPWLPFTKVFVNRHATHFVDLVTLQWISALLLIAWCLPNTQQLLSRHRPAFDLYDHMKHSGGLRVHWAPNLLWGCFALGLLLVSLYYMVVEGYEEFLYRFF
jgi:alginate O-acetyltransferase complex protein AlgI